MSKLWKTLNTVINRKKNPQKRLKFKHNNKDIVNNLDIANHFYNYYLNVTKDISSKIHKTAQDPCKYNLRSNRNITHALVRRQGLSRSFFPTVIREWNSLPVEIRLAETLHFSKSLDALYSNPPKRSWFSIGERFINIHHSRIRLGCSKLKAYLHFELHVEDSPHCACDQVNEDPHHYFFLCPFYKVQRVQMMNDLSQYTTGIPRLSHILYGNDALSEQKLITNIFSLLSINSLRILKDLKINMI